MRRNFDHENYEAKVQIILGNNESTFTNHMQSSTWPHIYLGQVRNNKSQLYQHYGNTLNDPRGNASQNPYHVLKNRLSRKEELLKYLRTRY